MKQKCMRKVRKVSNYPKPEKKNIIRLKTCPYGNNNSKLILSFGNVTSMLAFPSASRLGNSLLKTENAVHLQFIKTQRESQLVLCPQ